MARFAVESWSPEYGSPVGEEGQPDLVPAAAVDPSVELPAAEWQPIDCASADIATDVLFVDGVRRIDARLWFDIDGRSRGGIAASYAAGVIRCRDEATIEQEAVGRGIFAMTGAATIDCGKVRYEHHPTATEDIEQLQRGIQSEMGRMEKDLAAKAGPAELLFLDGPLRGGESIPGAVGYIKSHQAGYLPDEAAGVVGQLRPGQRTPLFLIQQCWSRYSWYVRLPIDLPGHPWAGIARCEVAARGTAREAAAVANRASVTLQRFASTPHKDTRAPQNLFPIAGLENHLRHCLGDREFLYRQLRMAALAGEG